MKIIPVLLLLLVLLPPARGEESPLADSSQATEQNLKKIDELMQLGIPGLALRLIEKRQPQLSEQNIQQWAAYEYKRLALLAHLKNWQKIIQRVSQQMQQMQQQDILFADSQWYKTQAIKARIQAGDNQQALSELQQLLWNPDDFTDGDNIAIWRQLVIRVYMNMDQLADAQRAMRRYRQDYGDLVAGDVAAWKRLQAQLLLRTHRAPEAVELFSHATAPRDRALLLLAKMQAGLLSDWAVEQQLDKWLENTHLEAAEKQFYQYALLIALASQKKLPAQIKLLEQLLTEPSIAQLKQFYYPARNMLTADYLWQLYEQLGMQLANENKLLQGDDQGWFLMASNQLEKNPLQARALFAILLFKGNSMMHRLQASAQFMKLLEKQSHGLALINQLFMHSHKISSPQFIPVNVRYRLVDFALSRADLKMAAELMAGLQQPPDGEDAYAWNLRRARVFILGGDYQKGAALLMQLLDKQAEISEHQADQLMQVIFDLQNIQQHPLALKLFSRLQDFELSDKLWREIPFWQAESYQALGNYEQAAYLYLQSARPINGEYDPWFHTASFRAAESLAEAGLIQDARRQYLRLLRITRNSARKAVIGQRLQQLRLKEHH